MAWGDNPWIEANRFYVHPNSTIQYGAATTYAANTTNAASITFKVGDQETTIDLTKKPPLSEVEKLLAEVEAVCDLAR